MNDADDFDEAHEALHALDTGRAAIVRSSQTYKFESDSGHPLKFGYVVHRSTGTLKGVVSYTGTNHAADWVASMGTGWGTFHARVKAATQAAVGYDLPRLLNSIASKDRWMLAAA